MLTACPAPCINSSNAGVVQPASPAVKASGYAATTVVRGLAAAGLGGRSGLALGIGLDRLLLVKRIPDIRLLRSGDPRSARQMLDLARYQPVSSLPAITQDLSVAVSDDNDEETLGDRVAMPSAPTRAVSRRSGCFPPPTSISDRLPRGQARAREPSGARRAP